MVTRNIAGILALFCGTCLAQPRLAVKVDPRFELIAVVETLTAGGFNRLLTTEDSAYRRDVAAWFSAYKNHPAIKRLTELAGLGYDHDAPMGTAVCLSAPPELTLEVDPEQCNAIRAGGAGSLLAWLDQLRDFARSSGFTTFFRAHAGLYSMMEEATRSKIPRDYAADLEAYFGTRQGSYTIVPAPLLASGNFGPSRRRGDGALDLYAVVAGTGQVRGVPQFGTVESLRYMVWHEFTHSFVNPEVDRLSASVERSRTLMRPIERNMRAQAYDEWKIAVYEHLVRAVTTRFAFRELGDEAGHAALSEEKARGFAYVEALADKLKEYEQQRSLYPAFGDFAPRLLGVLEELSTRTLPADFFIVPFTGTLASAASGTGPTVLIVPTGESDAAAQRGILAYVKAIQPQFFPGSRIVTDDEALAADLSSSRIIAYGTLAGNKWLARYKDSIPAVAILDRMTEAGPLRLIATMPNPGNRRLGATAYTATTAGAVVGIHDLFHGPTAYVIGKAQTVLKTGDYRQQDGRWVVK